MSSNFIQSDAGRISWYHPSRSCVSRRPTRFRTATPPLSGRPPPPSR